MLHKEEWNIWSKEEHKFPKVNNMENNIDVYIEMMKRVSEHGDISERNKEIMNEAMKALEEIKNNLSEDSMCAKEDAKNILKNFTERMKKFEKDE